VRCQHECPDAITTTDLLAFARGLRVTGRTDAEKGQRVVSTITAIEYSLPELQTIDGRSDSGKVYAHERHAFAATVEFTASR